MRAIFIQKQFPSVLGSAKWIATIKEQYVKKRKDREIYISKELKDQKIEKNIHFLIEHILNYYNQTWSDFSKESKGRAENKLRNWFVYFAIEQGYELKAIAHVIGNITASGVAQIRCRLQRGIVKNKTLFAECEKLKYFFSSSVKT